jgi:hypothetical protein
MTKKQTKKTGKARKTTKAAPAAAAPKPARTRERDPRLPAAGTTIVRPYKDRELRVKVLEQGFEFEGRPYRSLSAIASEILGCSANGFLFFKLTSAPPATPKAAKPKTKRDAPKDDAAEPAPVAASATA